jgi:hypothetical protein
VGPAGIEIDARVGPTGLVTAGLAAAAPATAGLAAGTGAATGAAVAIVDIQEDAGAVAAGLAAQRG